LQTQMWFGRERLRNINSKSAIHNGILTKSLPEHDFTHAMLILITAAASDAKITITNRVVTGHQVTAEWIASGIHTGDLPGLPASGRPFTIHGVTVVVRHEGKIVREALYYDVKQLHRQLG
jgi:steroid delta-isomerase-like uncharacterized protein